jgi:PAS domain S-box-containing protein
MAETRKGMAGWGEAWRWLTLALGAFAMIAAVLFVSATLADRDTALRNGRDHAEAAADLLAEQAERTLRVAQISADQVAAAILAKGPAALRGEGAATLRTLAAAAGEIGSIWVLDPLGRVIASSVSDPPPQVDLSDRDFMPALRGGAETHLSPMLRARTTGRWIFGWSQAVRRDGSLVAIVHVALASEPFAPLAERLPLGAGAMLALKRSDGAVLLCWPLPETRPQLGRARQERSSGVAEEAGPDGDLRIVAWRSAATTGVIAEASIARATMLAPFQERTLRNGLVFLVSIALAGGLASAAMRAGRREAAAKRAAEERGAALAEVLADRLTLLATLREGEARLRMAQQAGGIGLWDLDLDDARIALAGEVFAEWGLRGTEGRAFRPVPVRAVLRGIHADDRGQVVAALSSALRDGGTFEAEFRLAGLEPPRWIGVRAEPRATAEGQPRRLLGIARDVTAERLAQARAEEARAGLERRVAERTGALAEANARLREGEARFRGLFNATFQFIGLLSPDGTMLEANAAMLRLGGVRAGEVIGRPYWVAPWWPEDAATQALLRQAIADAAEGSFARRETAMRAPDGRDIAVDFSVTPVRDEDGMVSLLVAEARDVSALKAAQALLHEAQKMDTLGQLTGGVAHDFNNLLMAVLGNLAIARKRAEQKAPELLRQLDAATQAAERGATLTQRLLAFARRQDLKPAAVDLRGLLLGIEALLRRSAGPLVELKLDADEGLPPAHVDPHALELALVNLAVNARDAMPEGGRLHVRLAATEAGLPGRLAAGRWLTIAVADNGMGMDAATLSRAVEPFFTTKGPGQGTGLGLSMVHGLAAQSGGALVLESAPGKGTTATLWLPVSALRPAAEAAAEAAPSPGRGAVLVVDDEVLVLESTAAMLEELGYEPVQAESGEAALALLGARRDLVAVLTDHAMPGMTGAALAARIRRDRPELPVILATGYAGTLADPQDARPRLAKPYTLTQLSQALRGVLPKAAE